MYVRPAGNHEDAQDLQKIGEGRRVFERMRGVRIEETAAIGAEHLDGFLRGHRALGDGLGGAFERGDLGIRTEILNHALRYEDERNTIESGIRHVERRAGEVDPEVADGLRRAARESAHKRNGGGDAGRRGSEVMNGEPHHLREVTDGRLGRVGLPVGIGREADGGIECQVRADQFSTEALRIERQPSLEPLDQVSQHNAHQTEGQQRPGVVGPVLLGGFIDGAQSIDKPFDRPHDGMHPGALAFEQARHECAHGLGEGQYDHEEEKNLKPAACTSCEHSP